MKPTTQFALKELKERLEHSNNNPDDSDAQYSPWLTETVGLMTKSLIIDVILTGNRADYVLAQVLVAMFELGVQAERNKWEWFE